MVDHTSKFCRTYFKKQISEVKALLEVSEIDLKNFKDIIEYKKEYIEANMDWYYNRAEIENKLEELEKELSFKDYGKYINIKRYKFDPDFNEIESKKELREAIESKQTTKKNIEFLKKIYCVLIDLEKNFKA